MNWDISAFEDKFVEQIADRAVELADKHNVDYRWTTAYMDINACHANGCPLKLDELVKAKDGDFAHDVFGIRRHINRETGQLGDCFIPRYAV